MFTIGQTVWLKNRPKGYSPVTVVAEAAEFNQVCIAYCDGSIAVVDSRDLTTTDPKPPLKFKKGDRALIEVEVERVDETCSEGLPYQIMCAGQARHTIGWFAESDLRADPCE